MKRKQPKLSRIELLDTSPETEFSKTNVYWLHQIVGEIDVPIMLQDPRLVKNRQSVVFIVLKMHPMHKNTRM